MTFAILASWFGACVAAFWQVTLYPVILRAWNGRQTAWRDLNQEPGSIYLNHLFFFFFFSPSFLAAGVIFFFFFFFFSFFLLLHILIKCPSFFFVFFFGRFGVWGGGC